MSISGISTTSSASTSPASAPGSSSASSNADLLAKAETIAREGFELSLQAKQITNKYAAAKEVR